MICERGISCPNSLKLVVVPRGEANPLENHITVGILSNTGPNPLENHKATEPALNVGPSSDRHSNGVSLVGR